MDIRPHKFIPGVLFLSLLQACGAPDSDDEDRSVSTVSPPSVTLSASPDTVVTNGSTTIAWNSSGADECSASGDWSGPRSIFGSEVIVGITANQQFSLSCSGAGGSTSKTVNVTHVSGNAPPTANAGPDQNVVTGSVVNLNGNGSSDPNGDPLSFSWALSTTPPGSGSSISNPTSATPSFVPDLDGNYVIQLIVNDGTVDSNADSVMVVSNSASYDCTSNSVHCVDDSAGPGQEYSIIQNAVNVSQPGDVVVVFDGNYAGFRVSSSGTSSQPIKVMALSDGANIVSSEPFGSNAIRVQSASYVTIEGFRIDRTGVSAGSDYDFACIAARGGSASAPMLGLSFINNHLVNCAPAGMYLSNAENLFISGNVIKGTDDVSGIQGMGIYLANAGADNAVVVDNLIADNEGVAIHMNGDSSVGGDGVQTGHEFRRNIFENNGSNGLNMDGVRDILVENNIFVGNAKHGIRGYRIDGSGGPRNWVVVNNTFYNNETPAKATEDSGSHVFFNNVVVDNLQNTYQISGSNFTESNNLYSNNESAIFVDAATNDLRIKSASPAVNMGISGFQGISAPAIDISGAGRTVNPDAGAFELGSSYPGWYE